VKFTGILLLVAAAASTPLMAENVYKAQKTANSTLVNTQKKSDAERREEILRKMRIYMGELNSRLKRDPNIRTVIDSPVKTVDITDVKKTTDIHSKKPVPEPVFGYSRADNIKLYSEPGSRQQVGTLAFADKVQVLMRSDVPASEDKAAGNFIMVRRADESEGWVEEYFISPVLPGSSVKPQELPKSVESGKGFSVPAAGMRTSNFGYRVDPVTKKSNSFHSGIDIAAPLGTPVYAAAGGEVKITEFNKNGYGNLVVIQHESDLTTYYGHLSKIEVSSGVRVKKGDLVGKVGSTGKSTGPHLHFEVRKGDKAQNPDEFLR
jgi:murein DD-endopeptidase MepM/ murein hydrolase activator NlpD